jgi:NitT/TauT family transport system substrate-binding protein
MRLIQTRRQLLTSLSAAGAVGLLGGRPAFADEPPPEMTTIRMRVEDNVPNIVNGTPEKTTCVAPIYITEGLLRIEGFTDIRYPLVKSGPPLTQAFGAGDIDFALMFAPGAVRRLDAGVPITVLAGVHPGCIDLFAHELPTGERRPAGDETGIGWRGAAGSEVGFVLVHTSPRMSWTRGLSSTPDCATGRSPAPEHVS